MREKGKRFFFGNLKAWIFIICLAAAWIVSAGARQVRAAALQRGISRQVLRFHVLANSDGEADQQVKLRVRDGILGWLEVRLTAEEQENRELMEERLEALLPEMEEEAKRLLRESGFSYGASAELGMSWFPDRTYGDCTFPAGYYRALRITLGEGEGHNWWCVLFPRLCFLDCVHAVLPRQSESQLKNVLSEEEYESLFDPGEDPYRICFRYF